MRGGERPRADIAETVENAPALHVIFKNLTILALVKEEAGLLSFENVDVISDTRLFDHNLARRHTVHNSFFLSQPLDLARGRVVPEQDGLRGIFVLQCGDNIFEHPIDASGRRLDNERVGVFVHDQPWEAVAFTEDRAEGIAESQHRPKLTRRRNLLPKEPAVNLLLSSRKNSHGDQRVRVDITAAEEPARKVQHIHDLSGREFSNRLQEFVAEHPGVSAQDAPFFFLPEFYGFHEWRRKRASPESEFGKLLSHQNGKDDYHK